MWSNPPSRVLVPVDFGDASGRAVEVAAALASRLGARLHLLHADVLEAPAYFTQDQISVLERERSVARTRAEEFLAEFGHRHGAIEFSTEIAEGPATPAIVRASADAELVVMGTHGRRGPARWWLGSVAERVIHDALTPVLVVRAGADASPVATFARPMVVSADPTAMPAATDLAAQLARAFGGQVVETAAACAADAAAERQASMVVVTTRTQPGPPATHPAEQWLRSCTLPMLFVPAVAVDRSPR
jgi:nucleotide-binding universal stress UspA family protein